MNKRILAATITLMFTGIWWVTGCGGDDDDDSSSKKKTSTCCINGAFYDCSNSDKSCTQSGNTCTADSSRDSDC